MATAPAGGCDMPRQQGGLTRVNPYDGKEALKPWAQAITDELAALWLPPEPGPARADVMVFDSLDQILNRAWGKG